MTASRPSNNGQNASQKNLGKRSEKDNNKVVRPIIIRKPEPRPLTLISNSRSQDSITSILNNFNVCLPPLSVNVHDAEHRKTSNTPTTQRSEISQQVANENQENAINRTFLMQEDDDISISVQSLSDLGALVKRQHIELMVEMRKQHAEIMAAIMKGQDTPMVTKEVKKNISVNRHVINSMI